MIPLRLPAVALLAVSLSALIAGAVPSGAQSSPPKASAAAPPGVDTRRLARIDELVEDAIRDRQTPGAVVLVGRGDRIVYQKAFGIRASEPANEPMTLDTVFDLA